MESPPSASNQGRPSHQPAHSSWVKAEIQQLFGKLNYTLTRDVLRELMADTGMEARLRPGDKNLVVDDFSFEDFWMILQLFRRRELLLRVFGSGFLGGEAKRRRLLAE